MNPRGMGCHRSRWIAAKFNKQETGLDEYEARIVPAADYWLARLDWKRSQA